MNKTERVAHAVEPLIQWYKDNERPLPWRQRPVDPYRVWISEIMLQQTRIEAVIPYFHRFMKALPTVADLAKVSDDDLMKLWEGLGYYSRARNLKKAAIVICQQYGGCLPSRAELLEALPGIGSYTAGAIASIAFGQGAPAVDGNVLRVLTRLCAWDADISLEKTKKEARLSLQEVYPIGDDAGCLTQGLMELGEVCCIPNGAPLCSLCPISHLCLARERNLTMLFPVKAQKKQRRVERKVILLLEKDGVFAIRRRQAKGLLASMLEFPSVERQEDVGLFLQTNGLNAISETECGNSVHIFSHVEWHMIGLRIRCEGDGEELLWHTAREIVNDLPLPTAFRFYRELLAKEVR